MATQADAKPENAETIPRTSRRICWRSGCDPWACFAIAAITGRLLPTLLLVSENVLPQPMLYLSANFERHRDEYYHRLLAVSRDGQWIEWISFFLRGVAEQSRDAVRRSETLPGLWQRYRQQFQTARSSASLLKLIDELFHQPHLTISSAKSVLNVTFRSASLNVEKLVTAGILEELPGRTYARVFRAREIIEALEANDATYSGPIPHNDPSQPKTRSPSSGYFVEMMIRERDQASGKK